MYNNINQCDTIFALLALLDRNGEKDREQWKSLRMHTRHWFKIGSFTLALHARNVAISTNAGKIVPLKLRRKIPQVYVADFAAVICYSPLKNMWHVFFIRACPYVDLRGEKHP